MKRRSWAEPYKIKMVEPLRMTTRAEREVAIAEAGFNPFLLRSEDVYIDLLTDSGTNAMSDRQWAGLMLGDEAYAGSRNFYHLEETVREVYGFKHVIPTHQGRGAEHILSQLLIRPGNCVPGNMYFTTTKFHQELAGGRFCDVIVSEAHDPDSEFPFKGNVDLEKLQHKIESVGAEQIPYLSLETNVNMAGGQPCSVANIRATCELCHRYGIPVFLDATRAVENCYFIREREPGYGSTSLAEILREICSCADGCTVSAKKDCLVNIGGFLAVNDDELAEDARNMCVVYEGLHTYGGLAGRDLEAMAIGIRESVDFDHMHARIGQVEYLGKALIDGGVPVVRPIGGHGVFLNAAEFLSEMPRGHFRAQALCAALYVDSGVRGMERGAVSAGRDPETGENIHPSLELVRLTLPRRVYSQAHMNVVAESVIALHDARENVVGLRLTYEPKRLRFFQARFAPVEGTQVLRAASRQRVARPAELPARARANGEHGRRLPSRRETGMLTGRPRPPPPVEHTRADAEGTTMGTSLFLHEEIMLLVLRDQEGTVEFGADYLHALGGAILAELLIQGRVRVEEDGKKKIAHVLEAAPLGDAVIDECLEAMTAAGKPRTLEDWVGRFANTKNLKHRVARGLCRRGILRADEDKVLLIFTRKIYPEIDPGPESAIIERLRLALFTDAPEVDGRTAVLLSLAKGADVLRFVFDKKEIKSRQERLEEVVNGELTGRATGDAIEAAMQAALVVAVIVPIIVTSN